MADVALENHMVDVAVVAAILILLLIAVWVLPDE